MRLVLGSATPSAEAVAEAGATRAAVIVLNWQNAADTIRCLDELAQNGPPSAVEIVVVDNGSRDGSVPQIRAAHPAVAVLELPQNTGFARGINSGLRSVLPHDCDVVVLLNNDAWIPGADLLRAIELVRESPDIGLLTGKILRPDGRIWYGGAHLRRWRGGVHIFGQGEPDTGQCDKPRDVNFLSLAFALVRTEVIRRVGLLAEEYFFGQEEWDYSLRVRRAGYRLRYDPSIVCWHGGDGSHRNSAPEFIYNGYRNKIMFQEKYLPHWAFPLWRTTFSLYARTVLPAVVRHFHKGEVPDNILRFCAVEALRDQGRNCLPIEESDLLAFRDKVAELAAHTSGRLERGE